MADCNTGCVVFVFLSIYLPIMSNPCWGPIHIAVVKVKHIFVYFLSTFNNTAFKRAFETSHILSLRLDMTVYGYFGSHFDIS